MDNVPFLSAPHHISLVFTYTKQPLHLPNFHGEPGKDVLCFPSTIGVMLRGTLRLPFIVAASGASNLSFLLGQFPVSLQLTSYLIF